MKSKRGVMGLAILSFFAVFIIGFMMLNFLMPEITTFREDMRCAFADDIHDGNKVLCLITDTVVPYWILLIVSIAIGGITARWIF